MLSQDVLRLSLVFSISTVIYLSTVFSKFVYDDRVAICENDDVTGKSSIFGVFLHDFWGNEITSPGSHKSWRPLTILTFRMTHAVFGLDPRAFHLVNVLLHAIASGLVLRLAEKIIQNDTGSLFSAIMFAVHPIHTEAVANVVGRADILVTIVCLYSILEFWKNQNMLHVVGCTVIAMLCKETGIVLPILHLVQLIFYSAPKERIIRKINYLTCTTIMVALVRLTINSFQSPHFAKSSNPLPYVKDSFSRIMTLLYLPIFNSRLLIFPNKLCFDWSLEYIQQIQNTSDSRILIIVMFYTFLSAVFACMFSKFHSTVFQTELYFLPKVIKSISTQGEFLFSCAILIVPFIPASNLFVYVGFVIAERLLYFPSVGFCFLFGLLYKNLEKKLSRNRDCLRFLIVILLCLYSQKTITRNDDWKTGENLYRSGIEINPAKALTNLGRELSAIPARRAEAQEAYIQALSARPNMADTWYNLGLLYTESGNNSKAEDCYRKAIVIRGYFTQAFLNLGILLWQQRRFNESAEILRKCTQIDGMQTKNQLLHRSAQMNCWIQLARFHLMKGQYTNALTNLEQVDLPKVSNVKLMSSIYNLYGEIYCQMKDLLKADDFYTKALRLHPTREITYVNLAHLRLQQNRSKEAIYFIDQMEKVSSSPVLVAYNKAVLHTRMGNLMMAEQQFRLVLQLNPNHLDALNGLAMLLKDQSTRLNEAEKLLARVVELSPTSSLSYSNYGAILHMNGKLDEAENYYLQAVNLNSADQVAVQNLRKVRRAIQQRSSRRHT